MKSQDKHSQFLNAIDAIRVVDIDSEHDCCHTFKTQDNAGVILERGETTSPHMKTKEPRKFQKRK